MNESYSAWKETRVGKWKFELILKIYTYLHIKSIYMLSISSKKARLSETERFVVLCKQGNVTRTFLSDKYKIRLGRKKSLRKVLEKTRNYK